MKNIRISIKGLLLFRVLSYLILTFYLLGINPGRGAFNENKKQTPIRVFNLDTEIKLDWYKNGDARCKKVNKKWIEGYQWHQRDKGINTQFVVNMLDILYKVAELKYPDKEFEKDKLPFWHETFGQNIMFTTFISNSNI
jgi:hypothetical protein